MSRPYLVDLHHNVPAEYEAQFRQVINDIFKDLHPTFEESHEDYNGMVILELNLGFGNDERSFANENAELIFQGMGFRFPLLFRMTDMSISPFTDYKFA